MIDKNVARRVLDTVDAGLVNGLGKPIPGQMCVEAAVCYGLGLPHSDNPICVAAALRSLKITLNDSNWSSPQARAKGMRRLALIQLGSANCLNEQEFAKRVAEITIRKTIPAIMRNIASMSALTSHKQSLEVAANNCEQLGTSEAASAASWAARAASEAASDEQLSQFAENVVQILIDMNAPGKQWLYLTEL